MSDYQSITEEQLEAYFDDSLAPAERESFEQKLHASPELLQQVQMQQEIDASLRRVFPLQSCPEPGLPQLDLRLQQLSRNPQQADPDQRARRIAQIILLAMAACLAWVVVGWQLERGPTFSPYFGPKPLSSVYREVLVSGFEPYYECKEPDRFANTFLRRQGQALELASLPVGSRMLGLSYPGGLSRETTAMLCKVDQQPVIVFVDRVENDRPLDNDADEEGLHLHRETRHGLVLYEVSPFSQPRMLKYLVPVSR